MSETALRAIVIGAGFGGIVAAIRLREAGVEEITLLESRDGVGGVWRDNHYPGCACDIPAPLYSYSFAPNPDWTERFPPRAEIADYLDAIIDRYHLRDHLRLSTTATQASWDDATATWHVTVSSGEQFVSDLLIIAVGQLSRPATPSIPGVADFAGDSTHSAQWRDNLVTAERRVAVIGTGASAIQIVPKIAPTAAQVTVFQRSAPWTLPKPNQRYSRLHRRLRRRVPTSMKIGRGTTWVITQGMGLAVTGNPFFSRLLTWISTLQRVLQTRDRALLRAVTPDYEMGCKRVLFTSHWYPALRRKNVNLVTEKIDRVEADGVRTADGTLHRADLLVFSTGFTATELVAPLAVIGRDGTQLTDTWADGAHAHLGISVPGFPNLFLMYGPNTNTGNTSVVYFHEAQANYIAQAVRTLGRRGQSLEVRAEVEAVFDDEMQTRLRTSVWATCASWYRQANGRIVTNWPGMANEYARRTRRFNPDEFTRRTG